MVEEHTRENKTTSHNPSTAYTVGTSLGKVCKIFLTFFFQEIIVVTFLIKPLPEDK